MGRFVVFEGIDGAGAEEQSKRLLDFLKDREVPAEMIEYPGYHNPIGKFIHSYLSKDFDLIPEAQALIHLSDMLTDRDRIKEWLSQGKYVIANRYFTSTLAYQGYMGVKTEKLLKLAEIFGLAKPDIIIFLRVSAETSMQRKLDEKKKLDRNESDSKLMEGVAAFYEDMVRNQVFSSWYAIGGEKSMEDVFEQVKKVLKLD